MVHGSRYCPRVTSTLRLKLADVLCGGVLRGESELETSLSGLDSKEQGRTVTVLGLGPWELRDRSREGRTGPTHEVVAVETFPGPTSTNLFSPQVVGSRCISLSLLLSKKRFVHLWIGTSMKSGLKVPLTLARPSPPCVQQAFESG